VNGDELRGLRSELGKTQAQLAELLGITSNALARLERGERRISETLARLAQLTAERLRERGADVPQRGATHGGYAVERGRDRKDGASRRAQARRPLLPAAGKGDKLIFKWAAICEFIEADNQSGDVAVVSAKPSEGSVDVGGLAAALHGMLD
jgi:transcriptional regulator with XRE-family HTH domain